MANRSSCFAGRELALAFAPLPPARREAINAQFIRVFAGEGTPEDVSDMAKEYGCDVVVVVPQDEAWNNDPFAASPIIAWPKPRRPVADLRARAKSPEHGRTALQIPANQLKPCLLQNVSRKSLVTSIALIHFAFL